MDSGPSPWTAWYSAWLSLNPHLHMLFVDGVYTFDDERPRFHRGCAPTQPELQRLLHTIAIRVARAVERQGLLLRDDPTPSLDLESADGFDQLLAASVHYRIATGPHTWRKALTLRTVGSNPLAGNYTAPTSAPRPRYASLPHLLPPAPRLPDMLPSLPAPPNHLTSTAKRLRSHRQRT